MANIHSQVILAHKSALPRDAVVNNFYFLTATTPATTVELDAIRDRIIDFYNTVDAGTSRSIANFIGDTIDRGANKCQMKHYDVTGHLDGSIAGSYQLLHGWTLSAKTAGYTSYPDEVAVCLSFHSLYAGDVEFGPGGVRPRARDRGRIYLGPWTSGASVADATTNRLSLGASGRDTIVAAANRLLAGNAAGADWSVWSRANSTMDPVSGGWVDDAFDTQRRRGEASGARATFGA